MIIQISYQLIISYRFSLKLHFHSNHSAMIVEQKDLKIGKLESEVEDILDDMRVLENMKKQVKKIAKPDAADYIAKKVLKV